MIKHLGVSIRLLVVFMVLLAGIYSLIVTGVGQLVFPSQANGSLIRLHGRVIGARMVGQSFTSPQWFDSRPSAAGYDAAASAASNFGPTNPALIKEVKTNLAAFLKENPGVKAGQVPPAMVESSDSGLDPDITPQSAYLQAPRVARVDHVPLSTVRHLIAAHVRGRFLGMYGSPHVNVLELNLALLAWENHHHS